MPNDLLRPPSTPMASGCYDCRVLPHRVTRRDVADRRTHRHDNLMAHATYVEPTTEDEFIDWQETQDE